MPIFEYRCQRCEERFETLVRGGERPECPRCHGAELERLLSPFAVGRAQVEPPCGSAPVCDTCGGEPGSCAL